MRPTRVLAALAAMFAVLVSPGTAHAATITQPFAADSGDACPYGATDGALAWRDRIVSPLPLVGVAVKGRLTDRPLLNDPGTVCRDDGYNSTATFIAYAGNVEVARQSRAANNSTVTFDFILGTNAISARISRVVIQVCRSPIFTLPPSYCGRAIEYRAPPTA